VEPQVLKLFIPWKEQFNTIDVVKLSAAIALSFFLPGYALVSCIIFKQEGGFRRAKRGNDNNDINSSSKNRFTSASATLPLKKSLLKVLLGYIFSVLITGLAGYIIASFGIPVSGINIILPLLVIYGIILVVFVFRMRMSLSLLLDKKSFNFLSGTTKNSSTSLLFSLSRKIRGNDNKNNIRPEVILVFAALLALVILSTYYLYGGVIIGDQWFHHGRALMFISGTFRDIANSVQDDLYPPFLSAFLAAFISLSGNPSVNAYASISFLNIIPVLGFYYFFTRWVPDKWRNAALLASTLFVLSGGFGWIYALSIAISHPITSTSSSLDILHSASVKTFDIVAPSAFLLVSHPDFSTGLQLVVLPVGFVLLGLLKEMDGEKVRKGGAGGNEKDSEQQLEEGKYKAPPFQQHQQQANKKKNKKNNFNIKYFAIFTSISLLGILCHDEIYLFIIMVSVIPIIFGLPKKHFVYAAFLAAMAITLLVDRIYVENYFTSNLIFGVPLLVLSSLFVSLMWAIYVGKVILFKSKIVDNSSNNSADRSISNKLSSHIKNKCVLFESLKKVLSSSSYDAIRNRLRIAIAIVLVFVVTYWFVFTFIGWAQLPIEVVRLDTSGVDLNVPWYLFPMKLGLTGIIGLAFVLSYLFKKFKKEVFVFGVIAIIALFLGPYYNEQRTNKYIMLSMAGFASLLIYRLITRIIITEKRTTTNDEIVIQTNSNIRGNSLGVHKALLCGVIIGSVITLSSISVLLFIGYHASALETHNLDLALGRRNFPSASELNMLKFFLNNNINHKLYNIALSANEYDFKQGLIGKLQGFSAIPIDPLFENRLTLNASTLEGFYDRLRFTNSEYIVLPRKYADTIENGLSTHIIRFALENFQMVYHDANYLILKVPLALSAPSSKGDTAFVYQKNALTSSPSISDSKILLYNNESFKKIYSTKFVKTQTGKKNVVLYGDKETRTLWSNVIRKENISYVEGTLRVISENKTKNLPNYCGIAWDDGYNKYYTQLMGSSLKTSQIASNKTNDSDVKGSLLDVKGSLVQNKDITRERGVWYTLKIAFSKGMISIYIDNVLKQELPRIVFQKGPIVKVGISCSSNIGEFEPMKIGRIYNLSDRYRQKEAYYDNYYPLNLLALSNIGYDTFADNDYSAFSKKNVILAFDPIDKDGITRYLEYAKRGGTLIILGTDNKFQGGFSKLLSIRSGNTSKFEGIIAPGKENQHTIKIFGNTTSIESGDANVSSLSFYINKKNEIVSPLAIQKEYYKGKIVFLNIQGYFDAIFNHPSQYFSTLANFPSLIGLKANNYVKESSLNSVSRALPYRYIGDLIMSGQPVIINSSTLSLTNRSDGVPFYTESIDITTNHKNYNNKNNNSTESSMSKSETFKNVLIKELKLSGLYQVVINFDGSIRFPILSSQYDYIAISIPAGFDMTINLLDGASAGFTYGNSTRSDVVNNSEYNNEEIHFHKIKPAIPGLNSTSILVKSPEITIHGNASLKKIMGANIVPLKLNGKINAKVDHVDYYDGTKNYDSTKKLLHTLQYVTFLKWIKSERNTTAAIELALPGDTQDKSKKSIQLEELIFLDENITIKLLNILFVVSVLGFWVLWPKIKTKLK
jgi:hypothetical protein